MVKMAVKSMRMTNCTMLKTFGCLLLQTNASHWPANPNSFSFRWFCFIQISIWITTFFFLVERLVEDFCEMEGHLWVALQQQLMVPANYFIIIPFQRRPISYLLIPRFQVFFKTNGQFFLIGQQQQISRLFFSTGYLSYRKITGSIFIQALCRVLKDRSESDDLLSMMTVVLRSVAVRDEEKKSIEDVSQMPCFTSQLIRRVYFRPKIPVSKPAKRCRLL